MTRKFVIIRKHVLYHVHMVMHWKQETNICIFADIMNTPRLPSSIHMLPNTLHSLFLYFMNGWYLQAWLCIPYMYVLSIHKACKGPNTPQCVFCIDSYGAPQKEKQTILLCICTKSIGWNCVQKINQEVYVA